MDVDIEILSLISKLGHRYINEDAVEVYLPEGNPVKTLKGIRRLLNKDAKEDEDFGLESLSEVRAIQKHFVPLMRECSSGEQSGEVIDEVLKLLVILTLPNTKWATAHANELRAAVAEESRRGNVSPLALIVSRVEGALSTDASKRSEEDRKRVDLLLFFIRNMLTPAAQETAKEEFLMELQNESVIDIVLHFTTHVGRKSNREWDLLLLEIYFYLFRGTNPKDLILVMPFKSDVASAHMDEFRPSKTVAIKKELIQAKLELDRNRRGRLAHLPARHSHFGGVLTMLNEGERKPISSIYTSGKAHRSGEALLPGSIAQRKRRIHDASVVPGDILSAKNSNSESENVLRYLKHVADELVDKSYASLFSSIIQDFRREDARIKPDDEVRFIWMIRFFTQYARLRKDWFHTSIMTTMDLWSFQFIVNRVIEHMEQKAWASMETSVGALLEMMSNLKEIKTGDEGRSLKNAVFYELRERLEVIPKLLKTWDPACTNRSHLYNLTVLADVVLDTLEDMAAEGAMAKARSRSMKRSDQKLKASGVFNLSWSAEETFALAEGVKARRNEYDLTVMKTILNDPSLGQVFEDQKRTPQQLLARWMQVKEALATGKTLEQFIKEDMDKQEEDEEKPEGTDENAGEKPETVERQVDFFAALRSYLSNNVFRNLSRLIDPACHAEGSSGVLRDVESHRLVTKFFRRLRNFRKGLRPDDSLEALLWHVEIFDSWKRFLGIADNSSKANLSEETKELVKVLQSSIRRFFRHSEKNKLVFIEVLFWRTKQDNVFINRFYNMQSGGKKSASAAAVDDSVLKQWHEEELKEMDEESHREEDSSDEEDDEFNDLDETAKARSPIVTSKSKSNVPPPLPSLDSRTVKTKRSKTKKLKKTADRSNLPKFILDMHQLRLVIGIALKNGVSAESFTSIIRGFEEATCDSIDTPFIPSGLDETDRSFDSKYMRRVMLCLQMRPPNRRLPSREKDIFCCETYWRIPTSQMTMDDCKFCADSIRDIIFDENEPVGMPEFIYSDASWCVSEEEETRLTKSHYTLGEQEETKSTVSSDSDSEVSNSKLRLRRVVSSDDEVASTKNDIEEQKKHVIGSPLQNASQIIPKRRRVVSSSDEDE